MGDLFIYLFLHALDILIKLINLNFYFWHFINMLILNMNVLHISFIWDILLKSIEICHIS